MYRTVKTTDKPAASSGQSEGSGEEDSERGLRRLSEQRGANSDGSLQQEMDNYNNNNNPNASNNNNSTLWSNSSSTRENWAPQTNSNETDGLRPPTSFQSQQVRPHHHIQECETNRMKSYIDSNSECKNPSLEFTLGRPDWHIKET